METLREFGLSDYAARAYLALLDLGETEARDVARLSGVPLAKMYQVLDALHAKGLCDIFPENPKRFAPIQIERYVERIAGEHRKAADLVEARREDLTAQFPVTGQVRASDRSRTQLISGRQAGLDHEARLLAQASARVLVFCTPGRTLRMRTSLAEWEAAQARGVRLCMLIPDGPDWAEQQRAFSRIAEVRVREYAEQPRSRSVSFTLFDREDALILDHIPDDARLQRGHDVGIHLRQEGISSALQDALDALWEQAPAAPSDGTTVRLAPS